MPFKAELLNDFQPRFGWRKRVRCIRQTERSECGLACLTMILNYYGNACELSELRQTYSISSRGTSLSAIIGIASGLGLRARGVRVELNELTNIALPCIVHVDLDHFVVLCRVGRRRVQVADPAYGMQTLTWGGFSTKFTGIVLELVPNDDFVRRRRRPTISIGRLVFAPRGVKRTLINVFAISLLLEGIALVAPLATQIVVDDVIINDDTGLLGLVAISFAALLVLQILASAFRTWAITILNLSLNVQWNGRLFSHLLRLPESYFSQRHLGDVVSRFGSLDVIQHSLTNKSVEVILDGLMAFFMLGMLIYYSGLLAVITVLTLILSLAAKVASYRVMQDANVSQISLSARQQSTFLEAVRAVTEVKLNNGVGLISSRYLNNAVATSNASAITSSLFIVFGSVETFLFGFLRVVILFLGARLALEGSLTVGMLIAFISYSEQFTGRVSALLDFFMRLKILRVHSDRLSDIVLSVEEQSIVAPHGAYGASSHYDLELEHVSFRYSRNDQWVLKDCSLAVAENETVLITGVSGCGKSTMLKLMAGLLEPTDGVIKLGGVDILNVGKEMLRDQLSLVLQEGMLLTGTIAENIAFFDLELDQGRVVSAATIAGIHEEILALPMGYRTRVGDMGSSLSAGQRQRICIARGLYRRPKLLLLDEATSHLDIQRENYILRQIGSAEFTRVVVSHRPTIASCAHRCFQMLNGTMRQYVPESSGPVSRGVLGLSA